MCPPSTHTQMRPWTKNMSENVHAVQPFAPARQAILRSRTAGPTLREWAKHSALFLLTFITTTFAGIMIAAPDINVPEPTSNGILGYVLYVPEYYRRLVASFLWQAMASPALLKSGFMFSLALLTIL